MKRILILIVLLAPSVIAHGQGRVNFRNDPTTLISAGGVPMPVYGTQPFIFAIFLAPSTTVASIGITPTYSNPIWQNVGGYNTNTTIAPGRINNRFDLDVGTSTGFREGSTVDFLIRGWSANAGATWSEALANWNSGSPFLPMFIGSSSIGNDLSLSDGEFIWTVFGSGPYQVPGFNMVSVPEPFTLALVGFSAVLWLSRRRSP